VLGLLGMGETSYAPTPPQRARLARMHGRRDGALVPIELAVGGGRSFCVGGGGLCSTGRDYMRFLRMILNRGAGLLRAETVAAMTRDQTGGVLMERIGHR
jgi:CubicO group peptidase (beta-lactamase class C family)